jgi:hypothetical protein
MPEALGSYRVCGGDVGFTILYAVAWNIQFYREQLRVQRDRQDPEWRK